MKNHHFILMFLIIFDSNQKITMESENRYNSTYYGANIPLLPVLYGVEELIPLMTETFFNSKSKFVNSEKN